MKGKQVTTASPAALAKQLNACWDNAGTFFDALAEASLRGEDDPAARALVLLHRKFGRDVLARSCLLTPASRDYWSASAPLMHAVAALANTPEQLLSVLNHFRKGMAGDLAGGCVATCAQAYCAKNSSQAEAFINACEADVAESGAFLTPGLVGLSQRAFTKAHRRAIALCNAPDPTLRTEGAFALGRLDYTGHPRQKIKSVQSLKKASEDPEPSVLMSAARAAGFLLKTGPEPGLQEVLVRLAPSTDPAVQLWTANALVDLIPQNAEPWFRQCLTSLTSVPLENVHDMGPIDRLLSDLLQHDSTAVLAFLSKWAPKQEPCKEMFRCKSLRHALIGRPTELQRFITQWCASDHPNCHQLAVNLLSECNHRITRDQPFSALALDLSIIKACPVSDIEFIIRKLIGHCFVHPKEMASLVFSALRRPSDRKKVEGIVRHYFRSVILYNFPGTTRPFLEASTKKGSSRQRRIAQAILDDLQPYFDALGALPQLKEFSPSPIRLHKYQLAQSRQMQQSMKETEDSGEFIFSKLAKKMPVKAGRAFFFKQRTGPAENDVKLTDATPMQAISFSYEAPRQYSLDPVGCEYDLVIMRTETREEVAAQ